MKITFRDADFEALSRLWESFYPERYHVDPELIWFNTVDSPTFDWGASAIQIDENDEPVGFVAIKKPSCNLYKADQDSAHLCALAYKDPRVAIDLLSDAKSILRDRGTAKLIFGQDSRHFFPGCPTDCRALAGFLMVEGFQEHGEVFDLERDLSDYSNPAPRPEGFELRPLDASDLRALETFLNREFPGRWKYDVMSKAAADGPNSIYGLFQGKKVEGFAMLQDDTCKHPVCGGVWRRDLGERWGTLGPIGVTASLRGKRLGNALLGAALEHQRGKGVRRCIIDWTTLDKFYGAHGFQPTRFYKPMTLALE